MAGDEDKGEQPGERHGAGIGVELMQNLVKALVANTDSNLAVVAEHQALRGEIIALRTRMKVLSEDIEGIGGVAGEALGHLTTYLRILDHVAMASAERPPRWKDVQEILKEIKDEIQQEESEQEQEEEEEEEQGEAPAPPASPARPNEIFPKKR